ncbi:hypothetical protein [Algihabitans albus]|uniref:hypothetical protein n=1 Tax=Algihabitans albus TaxID=2164067 RepID=UPI000E5D42E3|nr:hypothetical protein [Algihabitans albus]
MRRLTALLALLPLAACGSLDGLFAGEDGPVIVCPRILPVVEAEQMTRFVADGRDLTEVDFRARLADVRAECVADEEEIELTLQVMLSASRGPANAEGAAGFSYFVAVATRDEQILARDEYQVGIPFEGNRTTVGLLDEVDVEIPLAEGQTGREYRVFLGLALTPDELEWNRQNR